MNNTQASYPADAGPDADPGTKTSGEAPRYSASGGLVSWLAGTGVSIAATSYQSGKFYLLGANPKGGLMVHERFFRQAMGLAAPREGTILLATHFQLMRFENMLAPGQRANELHDALFVPRTLWTTGAVDAHDIGMLPDGRPVFVATGWNCLATVSERHSFAEYWRPPFVSALVAEDRCHLNGLAMGEGSDAAPRYATACSRSDTVDGWRDRRRGGGVVIDVETNEIVCEGLSMPHSPRLHRGQLYVLDSGSGWLGRVNLSKPAADAFERIAFCPGFLRGLSLHGDFAVVGLSKPRYERFDGLPLSDALRERDSEPWCGIQVIDLQTGRVAHWFRIDGKIAELYDVSVIAGPTCPMAVGFTTNDIMGLVSPEPPAA